MVPAAAVNPTPSCCNSHPHSRLGEAAAQPGSSLTQNVLQVTIRLRVRALLFRACSSRKVRRRLEEIQEILTCVVMASSSALYRGSAVHRGWDEILSCQRSPGAAVLLSLIGFLPKGVRGQLMFHCVLGHTSSCLVSVQLDSISYNAL